MSNHRYSKFWWQDWQNDPALRVCSLAAQGLWIRLLCVMHDANPTGHLTINGKQPSSRQIAALVGAPEREVVNLVRELEDATVFSRTDTGVIFSRRMVRDAAKSEEGAHYISKRWGNRNGTSTPHKEPNTPPNRGSNGAPTTQYSESESEAESEPPTPIAGAMGTPADGLGLRLNSRKRGTNSRASGTNPRAGSPQFRNAFQLPDEKGRDPVTAFLEDYDGGNH